MVQGRGSAQFPGRQVVRPSSEWLRDSRGTTAIEFAMVALPFVLLLFGLLSVSLYFFTTFTLENAVWQAARAIRTGQVQQGQGDYATAETNEDRKKLFKKASCGKTKGSKNAVACCLPQTPMANVVTGRLCAALSDKKCGKIAGSINLGAGSSCFPSNPCTPPASPSGAFLDAPLL